MWVSIRIGHGQILQINFTNGHKQVNLLLGQQMQTITMGLVMAKLVKLYY